MGNANPDDVTTTWTALLCCSGSLLVVATILWVGLRKALGNSALPSSPKELVRIGRGSINGLVGGLIGGAIYGGISATSVFPTEEASLAIGVTAWAVIGGLSGMLGGGIGGLVNDRRYGQSAGLISGATAGAILGPVLLGVGCVLVFSVAGISVSVGGGSPLFVVTAGTFLGTIGGAYLERR